MALRSFSPARGYHPEALAVVLGGRWRNQLGSELVLEPESDGNLRGTYRTATGAGTEVAAPVHGSWDPGAGGDCVVVGFAVAWRTVHAVTTWCGRYRAVEDTIEASWLMSSETDPHDDWRSTFTGHDVFHRG
ncbi:MAG: hypothetical protein KGJ77_13445 [Acidobacteriota bacterium]|nr:hypothetical protein [Acidobacteriota bacterium]